MRKAWFLAAACLGAFLLWLPHIGYPVVSDTMVYAFLGENLWTTFSYHITPGIPHVKFLPMYPILSYPFVWALGYHVGMKTASLLSGMGVLIASFFLLRRMFSETVAKLSVIAIIFQPGFITMTMLGASDLLCTLFFLVSLICYLNAEKKPMWYMDMGFFLGLSLLTRYNVVPLFLFYPVITYFERPHHLGLAPRSSAKRSGVGWFWGGMVLGGLIFSTWFIRKALLFGSPFANDYTEEFAARSTGVISQAIENLTYYIDPFKNILPILFVLALFELVRRRGKPYFLSGAMLSAWALFLFWPVRNLRYAFPGYVILIGYGVSGLLYLLKRAGRYRIPFAVIISGALVATHLLSICLYTYGQCNAAFDRYIGLLPKDMGLTSEGHYAWLQARDYINANAEQGAFVRFNPIENQDVFRSDLRASENPKDCPAYLIWQKEKPKGETIFQTEDAPVTGVVKEKCL